jgi:dTMP kinase
MNKEGLLITFEGPEGGGKTTLVKEFIKPWIQEDLGFGENAIFLREPGGTPISEEIREILLNKSHKIGIKTEVLLFQAGRAENCDEIIRPALETGKLVFIDRFGDSSIAYQGCARSVGVYNIDWLNKFSTGGIIPDVTFLLDIDPEIGLRRRDNSTEGKNRLDKENLDFHHRVREGYLSEVAGRSQGRWIVINADRPQIDVATEVMEKLEERLVLRGFLEGQISKEHER